MREEERIYIQGRVYAKTQTEALEMIETVVTKKGYTLTRPPNIRPAFTQHIKGVIWWEYIIRVQEHQSRRCLAANYFIKEKRDGYNCIKNDNR